MKILLMIYLAVSAVAQTSGGSYILQNSSPTWTNLTYGVAQKKLQMHKDNVMGNFVLMPIMVEDGAFALTVESKDEMFTQLIVTVFYRVQMQDRAGSDKSTSLLLSKETVMPAVLKARVMSNPFYVPWSSVEFVRIKGVKEIEQQEFK